MSGPRAAMAFLTPFGGATPPTDTAFGWFPVVGAGLGASLGLLWWGAGRAWPRPVAAALVVLADLALTGLLHFDGLVDSVDGLFAPVERSRRLAIMADPQVGAFGAVVGAAVLVLRFAALSVLAPSVLLLAGLWCGSRAFMAVVPALVPYARADTGGLATGFLGEGRGPAVIAASSGVAGLVTATALWHPLAGPVSALAGGCAAAGVVWLGRRRLGGYTGDVLGAAGVVFETVALVVAAARW